MLIETAACLAKPPVADKTKGVNVACSTSFDHTPVSSDFRDFYSMWRLLNSCWMGHRG